MTENMYVNVESLAKYFGVSTSTIRKWVREGIISRDHYIRAGDTYRYNRKAIEQALTKSRPPKKTEEVEVWTAQI